MQVVGELSLDIVGHGAHHAVEYLGSEAIGDFQVVRVARGANPAERTETVVEEHGTHDVLNVAWIAEVSLILHDVGTSATCHEHEGVAIVEEVHAVGSQAVDCCHLATQRLKDAFFETLGLLGHHALRLL